MTIGKVISVAEVAVVTNVDAVDMTEVVVAGVAALIEEDSVDEDAVVVRLRCPSELPTTLIHTKENIWSVGRVCSNGKFLFLMFFNKYSHFSGMYGSIHLEAETPNFMFDEC